MHGYFGDFMIQSQVMVYNIIFAILIGAFGQGIRMIAGLKKQSDKSAAIGQSFRDGIDLSRLVISLFIGAMAGIAAFLGFWQAGETDPTKGSILFGIMAAGYSGADFIEGFIKKYLPGANSAENEQESKGKLAKDQKSVN